jgi:hypothetical protein
MKVYRFEPRLNSVSARQSALGSATIDDRHDSHRRRDPFETELVFFDLRRSRLELQAVAAERGITFDELVSEAVAKFLEEPAARAKDRERLRRKSEHIVRTIRASTFFAYNITLIHNYKPLMMGYIACIRTMTK